MIKNIFLKYSQKSRKEKIKQFFLLMQAQTSDILLDAGGGIGEGFEDIWKYFKKVIVLDFNVQYLKEASRRYGHVCALAANACYIPLADKSVDFVFSNAVIEHIDKGKQYLFANEIKRIAKKGFFVATPNLWFPIEPHYIFPFWQFLPGGAKITVKKFFNLGHYPKGHYDEINLLSNKDLKKIFLGANVMGVRITCPIPESLVSWWRAS